MSPSEIAQSSSSIAGRSWALTLVDPGIVKAIVPLILVPAIAVILDLQTAWYYYLHNIVGRD